MQDEFAWCELQRICGLKLFTLQLIFSSIESTKNEKFYQNVDQKKFTWLKTAPNFSRAKIRRVLVEMATIP